MTTSRALTYEFRVEGHLDDHWSAWLGDLTITRHHDGTSTLTGPVADQAQLHGMLARLRDIGATLLSLNAVEAPAPRGITPAGRAVRGCAGPWSGPCSTPSWSRPGSAPGSSPTGESQSGGGTNTARHNP